MRPNAAEREYRSDPENEMGGAPAPHRRSHTRRLFDPAGDGHGVALSAGSSTPAMEIMLSDLIWSEGRDRVPAETIDFFVRGERTCGQMRHAVLQSDPCTRAALLPDDLPLVIKYGIRPFEQNTVDADDKRQQARQDRRPDDIDEKTIPRLIGFIKGLMQKRVIENKQLVFAPIIRDVSDNDVGRIILHGVDIVEDP
jgi:hypothetical protein